MDMQASLYCIEDPLIPITEEYINDIEALLESAAENATAIISKLLQCNSTAKKILNRKKIVDGIYLALVMRPKVIYHNVLECLAEML